MKSPFTPALAPQRAFRGNRCRACCPAHCDAVLSQCSPSSSCASLCRSKLGCFFQSNTSKTWSALAVLVPTRTAQVAGSGFQPARLWERSSQIAQEPANPAVAAMRMPYPSWCRTLQVTNAFVAALGWAKSNNAASRYCWATDRRRKGSRSDSDLRQSTQGTQASQTSQGLAPASSALWAHPVHKARATTSGLLTTNARCFARIVWRVSVRQAW
jgi:hypothetical protein